MNLKTNILKLRKEGKTYSEIATSLGCSKGTVSYHCRKLPNNNEITKSVKKHVFTKEILEQIQQLINIRCTHKETAMLLGLDLNYVIAASRILKKKPKLKNNYKEVKNRRMRLKLMAVLLKGGKCERCGYVGYLRAYDFHHRDPTEKEFAISMITSRSWESVKKEIEKCDLLCARCHREIHCKLEDDINIKDFAFAAK